MKLPDEEHEGGIHRYVFTDLGLEARLERVHVNQRGMIGELRVSHKDHGHLHEADLVLMSSSSRETFHRALKSRAPELELPWPIIVETIAVLTKRNVRQEKAQIVNLMEKMATSKTTWCCYPYIVHGGINVLYGPPGVAKSTLAVALGICLITKDGRVLSLDPQCRHKGLYLDWEDEAETHAERMRRMLTPYPDIELFDFAYMQCSSPLVDMVEELRQVIAEQQIEFLIADSAVYLGGDDPNKDETVRVVKGVFNEFPKVTKLLIAHDTKDKGRGIRGSLIWQAMARNVWELKAQSEPGQPELHIALYHRKGSKVAHAKSQGYRIEFDDEADETRFYRESAAQIPELAKTLTLREQITEALKHQARTVSDLAEELSEAPAKVRARLNDGRRVHLFAVVGEQGDENLWGLEYRDR